MLFTFDKKRSPLLRNCGLDGNDCQHRWTYPPNNPGVKWAREGG